MCENCPERGTLCPNCGADPCYHLCHNSVAYYSPEQERYDAMMDDGSDDVRERYASTVEDANMFFSEADHEIIEVSVTDNPDGSRSHEYTGLVHPEDFTDGGRITPDDSDDIPF